MALYDYGVGGNEVKPDTNEAIQDIQQNKTLVVSQLTPDEAYVPEVVTGLKNMNDVFNHFQPSLTIEHTTKEGTNIEENFKFNNLGDFTPKNLVKNSAYLKKQQIEQEQYNKIVRQLKSNKVLKKVLEDKNMKEALSNVLKDIANELSQK